MRGLRDGSVLLLSFRSPMKERLLIFFVGRVGVYTVRRKGDTWSQLLHLLDQHTVGRSRYHIGKRV